LGQLTAKSEKAEFFLVHPNCSVARSPFVFARFFNLDKMHCIKKDKLAMKNSSLILMHTIQLTCSLPFRQLQPFNHLNLIEHILLKALNSRELDINAAI